MNTVTGKEEMLYECELGYKIGSPTISPDKKYIAITKNEVIPQKFERANYGGFLEGFYYQKNSYIMLVYLDGSGVIEIFADTHALGHAQFAPDDSTILSFCHEGPWNYVQQRIWLLDIVSRKVKPCFRQTSEDDCVGHECWTRNGLIFFDNRRRGHDGTITSDRMQAVALEQAVSDPDQIPYVGFADKSGEVIKKIELPYYCNHYHINGDNTLLVGDGVDNIVLINVKNQPSALMPLCYHGTSWRYHHTHCHPTWSWDGSKILFTSDRGGDSNLYMLDMTK